MAKVLRQEVEFIEEWMGNPVGSKKTILIDWAKELEKRKTVKFIEVKSEDGKSEGKTEEKTEEKVEEKVEEKPGSKMMQRVKDKMMRKQENK